MSTYRYRVSTTCTAYLSEDWIVTSDQPLTLEEAEAAVLGDLDTDTDDRHVGVACVDQDVTDEHDRSVAESYVLEEREE